MSYGQRPTWSLLKSNRLLASRTQGRAQVLVPQISVNITSEAASQFNLTPGALMRSVTTLVNGMQVGEVYKDQNIFGVIVRGGKTALHSDLRTLSELMIDTPAGGQVPLGDVAELSIVPAPNEIKREAASRRIDITCNVDGRDLGSVATEIERAVLCQCELQNRLPSEFLGEYAEAKASRNRLLLFLSLLSARSP